MLAWLAFVIAPFPEFDPWKAKERWSDLPTFENIVKECMLSYDHFFDFDRVEELVLNHANAACCAAMMSGVRPKASTALTCEPFSTYFRT